MVCDVVVVVVGRREADYHYRGGPVAPASPTTRKGRLSVSVSVVWSVKERGSSKQKARERVCCPARLAL